MTKLATPDITYIDSRSLGARSVIMVGVHGNEKVGPMILDWLKSLEIVAGKLVIVVANPTALEQNVRYIHANLNRRIAKGINGFPEDSLAVRIREELDQSDALLDIHSYNEPMDRPFIITDGKGLDIAKYLPGDYVITNWSEPGQAQAGDDYMLERGKVGICFECGSSDRPSDYVDTAKRAVLSFLQSMGNIEGHTLEPHTKQIILRMKGPIKQTEELVVFNKDYVTFDALNESETFARQGSKQHIASAGQHIIFPRPKAQNGDEAFYIAESGMANSGN